MEVAPAVNVNNVYAAGFPGEGSWAHSWKMGRTDGSVIITNANGFSNTTYQSSNMNLIAGMSGGPLVDSGNTVMGVNTNKSPTRFVRITPEAYKMITAS